MTIKRLTLREKISKYVADGRNHGYPLDIPDECPHELMVEGLVPTWKAIAIALLRNDMHLTALGFSAPQSEWYGIIKRIEIENREEQNVRQSVRTDI